MVVENFLSSNFSQPEKRVKKARPISRVENDFIG
jgi:hypothetical protein